MEKIEAYHQGLGEADREICQRLAGIINTHLPATESKIWHGHPVWFINGNPIVGYSKQKRGVRLMFWSGADFDEDLLAVHGKKFKDASVFYNDVSEIKEAGIQRCLHKATYIQWDYQNIVKRKGRLEKIEIR